MRTRLFSPDPSSVLVHEYNRMDLYKSLSSNPATSGQQQFTMKPESLDHDLPAMLNNNHLYAQSTSNSSHFMNDLYMVKRNFNTIVTENNTNHHLMPSNLQSINNQGKRLGDELRCVKRTHDRNNFPGSNYVPTAVRRNERERNRVKMVNLGFSTLRQHVPNGAKNKKMSKVETLRSAVDHIKNLQKLLAEG